MRIFSIPAAILIIAAAAMGQTEFPLGGKVHDPRSSTRLAGNLPQFDPAALPSAVDLSAHMPPVGTQTGSSCTGWSVGYYFKTYQEWRERGWSTADSAHICSPAFIYNQLDSAVDWGADLFDALELLCAHGCAPLSQMPDQSSYTAWPSEAAFDSALSFRCQSMFYFYIGNNAGVDSLRSILAGGSPVVYNISVYYNFDHINDYDTTYCVANLTNPYRGSHNQCLVGYDDNKSTADGKGAFRAVNSWGTGWGNKGYYWISYAAMKNATMVYPYAGFAYDRISYQPTLKARVRVAHNNRGSISFRAGIGDWAGPLWSKRFYVMGRAAGEYWCTGGNQPFPATNMVLDLSEGLSYLDSTASNNIFVGCVDTLGDGVTGNIAYLAAEYSPWGASAVSAETPGTIPDYNAYAYCNVALSKPAGVANAGVTGVSRVPGISVYPNPARARCEIRLDAGNDHGTSVRLYDLSGRLVRTLALAAGQTRYYWDLRDQRNVMIAPGVYFVRAAGSGQSVISKLIVVK